LDFTRPIGLMLMGILGLVRDYDETRSITNRLMEALPAGSYLALYDGTDTDPAYVGAIGGYNRGSGAARFFDGLELLEPGVVTVSRWRPEPNRWDEPTEVACAGGVGRKP